MSQDPRDFVAALSEQVAGAMAAGHVPEDVARLVQRTALLSAEKRWPEAIEAYEQLARRTAELGDVAAEGLARYGQAIALFHVPDSTEAVKEALQQTLTLATAVGHHTLAAKAHHLFSGIATDEHDLAGAIAHETQALEHLDVEREPLLAVQIYRSRSTMHWLAGRLPKAREDLDSASRIAGALADSSVRLSLEADRRVLEAMQSPAGFTEGPFDALFEQARRAGKTDVLGDAALFQAIGALRAQQPQRALERAEIARHSALQSRDPQRAMRYYAACLVVAAARQTLEDRPGVIEVLLTCKVTLERELGKEAGQLAVAVLDTLPEQWGMPVFQEALAAYRQRVRQA